MKKLEQNYYMIVSKDETKVVGLKKGHSGLIPYNEKSLKHIALYKSSKVAFNMNYSRWIDVPDVWAKTNSEKKVLFNEQFKIVKVALTFKILD